MSVQGSSASVGTWIRRELARRVAGVLAKSTRQGPGRSAAPSPSGCSIRRPTKASRSARSTPRLDALPEPPLPGQWPFVRGGDALRDVKSGWKVAESFPLPDGRGRRRQRRGAARADRRRQRAGAAGRRGRRAAADLDRLLEGVFLELVPVIARRGRRLRRRRGCRAGPGGRPRRRPARAAVDRPRRRSVDGAAERADRRRRSTRSSRRRPRRSDTAVACARSPSTGPAFHDLGASASWELAGASPPAVGYLRLLGDGGVAAAGCAAADQLPLRRRRRPVHDDREVACGAPAVGAGGRGGRASPMPVRRRSTRSRRCR